MNTRTYILPLVAGSLLIAGPVHADAKVSTVVEIGDSPGVPLVQEAQPIEDEEEFEDVEMSGFCGGEDYSMSPVDEAIEHYYNEDYRAAATSLANVLRTARLERQERVNALTALGATNLALGRFRRAAISYRRAIELSIEEPPLPVRVGRAIALSRTGRIAEAQELANEILAAECASDQDALSCYPMHVLLAHSTAVAHVRRESLERARIIEDSNRWSSESFANYRAWIGLSDLDEPTVRVADAR